MAEVTLKPVGAQDAASVLMQVRRLITTNPASAFLMMMQRIIHALTATCRRWHI